MTVKTMRRFALLMAGSSVMMAGTTTTLCDAFAFHPHLIHPVATSAAHHIQKHGGVVSPSDLHDTFQLLQHSATAMVHKVAHQYSDALQQHPLVTKMLTGGTLATCGDAIAQSQVVDEPYDKRRAFSFMLFDMAYRALQHVAFPVIVNECHGQYLQAVMHGTAASGLVSTDYLAAAEQTLVSQLVIVPFMYYPVFFALTAAIQNQPLVAAVERAKEKFVPLMQRNLLFWLPVQFIQFGFIDEQLQIPFLSAAGLCWTFILSAAAGSAKATTSSQTAPAVPAPAVEALSEQDKALLASVKADKRATVTP